MTRRPAGVVLGVLALALTGCAVTPPGPTAGPTDSRDVPERVGHGRPLAVGDRGGGAPLDGRDPLP